MLDKYFPILLVDDEPDVLAISKLTLKQMKFNGLPVRIHEARSKQEAIEFLNTHPEATYLAMALIDVVMETDHAGLELCRYIREDLKNHVIALVVRTGQAGTAPEREVIDRYDITGYIEKVEATEQRLYSIVKAGIRLYSTVSLGYYAWQVMHYILMNIRSPERFMQAVEGGLQSIYLSPDGEWLENMHSNHALFSPRFFVGTDAFNHKEAANAIREKLMGMDGEALNDVGDKIVVTDDHMLIHVAPKGDFPEPFESLWSIGAPPPAYISEPLYMVTQQLQILTESVPW